MVFEAQRFDVATRRRSTQFPDGRSAANFVLLLLHARAAQDGQVSGAFLVGYGALRHCRVSGNLMIFLASRPWA
jgi:hypothetical protein